MSSIHTYFLPFSKSNSDSGNKFLFIWTKQSSEIRKNSLRILKKNVTSPRDLYLFAWNARLSTENCVQNCFSYTKSVMQWYIDSGEPGIEAICQIAFIVVPRGLFFQKTHVFEVALKFAESSEPPVKYLAYKLTSTLVGSGTEITFVPSSASVITFLLAT